MIDVTFIEINDLEQEKAKEKMLAAAGYKYDPEAKEYYLEGPFRFEIKAEHEFKISVDNLRIMIDSALKLKKTVEGKGKF